MAMRVAWKDTLAPLTNANARLTFLMVFVAILWLLPDQTWGDWVEGLKTAQKAILSFFIALPAFVLLNAFCAVFKAAREIRASGLWFEHRFVYNEPLRVLTVLADDKDNDKTHLFKVDDAEIGSLVEILIEIDSPLDRVKAQVVWPKGQNLIDWGGVHKNIRTRLSLPKDKLLGLRTHAIPESSPVAIRVYVASWEISKL